MVAADRLQEKTISRKGREIDRWYSAKAHGFGGNIQALFTPGGIPLWVSPVLPGGVHDITAAREHALAILRPCLVGLPVLADSGYEGARIGVHVAVKKPAGGRELDLDNRTRNALRCLGERGFALMSQRWRTLQHVMLYPRPASSWPLEAGRMTRNPKQRRSATRPGRATWNRSWMPGAPCSRRRQRAPGRSDGTTGPRMSGSSLSRTLSPACTTGR